MTTPVVSQIVATALSLGIQYITGSASLYLPVFSTTQHRTPSHSEIEWLQQHKRQIIDSDLHTAKLQLVANAFSLHFGYARLHAVTFFELIMHNKDLLGNKKAAAFPNSLRTLLTAAFFTLLDKLRSLDKSIDPTLHYSLQNLRPNEWIVILQLVLSDYSDHVYGVKTVIRNFRNGFGAIAELPADRLSAIKHYTARNLHQHTVRERVAAGGLPPGAIREEDLKYFDCQPLPTTEYCAVDLNSVEWTTIHLEPFFLSCPTAPTLPTATEATRDVKPRLSTLQPFSTLWQLRPRLTQS